MRTNSKLSVPTALVLAALLAAGVVACAKKDAPPAETEPAAPTTQAVWFVGAELGRAVGGDRRVTDATDDFGPNDTIYVSVETEGRASTATLGARWTYQDGQEVERSETTISPNGREQTEFHIAKPDGWPAGDYQVEITLDGQTVDTLDFEVAG
jgi:hypothetical protein